MNRKWLARSIEGTAFSETETECLLKNLPPDRMPQSLRDKIKGLGLAEYIPVLGRNLNLLWNSGGSSPSDT